MIQRCFFCSRIDFCVGVKAHHKSSRKLTCYDLTCVCEQMFWTFIFTIHAESDEKTSLDDIETFMMPLKWFSSRLIQLQIDNGQANQDLNLSTYERVN